MLVVFDLDGTLCETEGMNYACSKPIKDRIEKVNSLFYKENTIVIQTARAKRWEEFTRQQLREWNVCYDILSVGDKVPADLYVDDRGINDKDFFK